MCYSFQTSLISYILGMASAIFAFSTRQIVLGCLILAYTQIQLSEMMIWYGIDHQDTKWNKIGTNFGKYTLPTHNIAIGIGIILAIIFVSKRKLQREDFIPLIIGILFYVGILYFVYKPSKHDETTFPLKESCNKCQNPENRLSWPWPYWWYIGSFIISVMILFIWIKPPVSKFILLTMFSLILLISLLIYPRTVGSVWCWSASFIAPVIVLINYYITRNEPSKDILV